MRTNVYLKFALLVCLSGLSCSAYSAEEGKKAGDSAPQAEKKEVGGKAVVKKLNTVLVEKATEMEQVVNKKYIGRIEAIQKVDLQPRVSGNIVDIKFQEGAIVKKGDLLFELEDVRYRAGVQAMEAKIAEIDAKLDYAKRNAARQQNLLQTKAVSVDTAENSKSEVNSLTAQKMEAEAQLITTKDDLAHTRIYAPITGRIGRVSFTEGNYITPTSGPLATIVQVDPVYVRFPISERDYIAYFGDPDALRKHARLTLKMADGHIYEGQGAFAMMDNKINSGTDTINTWMSFENKNCILNAGGVVTVLLEKKEDSKRPTVLLSAVMNDSHGSFIYVLDDKNVVSRRDIRLGEITGNRQFVTSGLKTGETVIIDGTHKAMPGVPVKPIFR